jgi:hypothetical protein
MFDWAVKLDDGDAWPCRHVGLCGEPAPAATLRLNDTVELNPGFPTSAPRRWTECPDCGTYWRVWPRLGIAKLSAEWDVSRRAPTARRYRRAPVLDIDWVMDLVKSHLPQVRVVQYQNVWPADDEGVWFFRLPDIKNDIQLESSTGMCPFFVEHDGMKSPADGGGWNAMTVDEAARMVVDYLLGEAGIGHG